MTADGRFGWLKAIREYSPELPLGPNGGTAYNGVDGLTMQMADGRGEMRFGFIASLWRGTISNLSIMRVAP